MFSTKTDNNWLHQVGEVCATTLELLEEKADAVGHVSHADENERIMYRVFISFRSL